MNYIPVLRKILGNMQKEKKFSNLLMKENLLSGYINFLLYPFKYNSCAPELTTVPEFASLYLINLSLK